MKWYKNPLNVFMVGLCLFALGAVLYNFRLPVLALVLTVLGGAVLGFQILKRIDSKGGHLLSNTLITALIALLLLNPALKLTAEALGWTFLGGLIVIMAKWGPKYKRQLIFNPTAFGLLGLSFLLTLVYGNDALLPTFVSWWGTDFAGFWALIILFPVVFYGAYQFRKLYLGLTFLVLNAAWLYFSVGIEALLYPFTSGMLYFLAGIMLLEPKTSPTNMYWQIAAGVVAFLAYRFIGQIGLSNAELWTVIMVNLMHLISRLGLSKVLVKLNSKYASL